MPKYFQLSFCIHCIRLIQACLNKKDDDDEDDDDTFTHRIFLNIFKYHFAYIHT